jgi:hypothetical protein
MHPDIIVLKYIEVDVLVVKVKNGGKDGEILMTSTSAAGQCLDYAYGLKLNGIGAPIVCLSIYSQMRIESSERSIKDILDMAIERLSKVDAYNSFGQSVEKEAKPRPIPEMTDNRIDVPSDGLETGRVAN